jgi:hypothetical protein
VLLCLRQGLVASAWLHRIEHLVPKIRVKAEQDGGIVVAQLKKKRLPDGRLFELFREAKLAHQDAGGTHQRR